MQRPWHLNRGLVVLVLAVFLRQTLVPSFVSAQDPEPDPDVAYREAAEELALFYRRLADVRDAVLRARGHEVRFARESGVSEAEAQAALGTAVASCT
jgi:hypothetical protein